jgi:hypothetical protein
MRTTSSRVLCVSLAALPLPPPPSASGAGAQTLELNLPAFCLSTILLQLNFLCTTTGSVIGKALRKATYIHTERVVELSMHRSWCGSSPKKQPHFPFGIQRAFHKDQPECGTKGRGSLQQKLRVCETRKTRQYVGDAPAYVSLAVWCPTSRSVFRANAFELHNLATLESHAVASSMVMHRA